MISEIIANKYEVLDSNGDTVRIAVSCSCFSNSLREEILVTIEKPWASKKVSDVRIEIIKKMSSFEKLEFDYETQEVLKKEINAFLSRNIK